MSHFNPLLLFGASPWIVLASTLAAADPAAFDHSHELWSKALAPHVRDGLVDYRAWQSASEGLENYLDGLAAVSKDGFDQWTEPQQLAYLLNYYNAATIRLVLDHYPIKSIRKIGGLFSGPWDQPVVLLFGERRTLDYLEHQFLRKKYKEPRIHFALVCAALGCPALRPEAYRAANLNEQLDEQGRAFLRTSGKNRVDLKTRTVHLSPIFKWFAADFKTNGRSVLEFVRPYLPPGPQRELEGGSFRVRYTDYDWSLNELKEGK